MSLKSLNSSKAYISQSLLKFSERTLFHNQNIKIKRIKGEPYVFVFLSMDLKISVTYAWKLRTVEKIWYEYKGLRNLVISFIEFYQRLKEIILLSKKLW